MAQEPLDCLSRTGDPGLRRSPNTILNTCLATLAQNTCKYACTSTRASTCPSTCPNTHPRVGDIQTQVDIVNIGCLTPSAWETDFVVQLLLPIIYCSAVFARYGFRCVKNKLKPKHSAKDLRRMRNVAIAQSCKFLNVVGLDKLTGLAAIQTNLIDLENLSVSSSVQVFCVALV